MTVASRRFGVLPLFILLILSLASAEAEDFTFSAESMSGTMTKGKENAVLVGSAVVVSGAMTIRADRIVLYGVDFRFADCTGRVTVVDDDRGLRLSTERLFYDRTEKISRLTGPSVMEDRKNHVVVKGNYIEHDERRDIAVIQINVRILKDDISCRAEFVRFDRGANGLELSGSPYVKRGTDEYRARLIIVDLDTEDIRLEGAVSGSVNGDSEATDQGAATAPADSGQESAP